MNIGVVFYTFLKSVTETYLFMSSGVIICFLAIAKVQRQISTDPANPQFVSPTDQRSPLQIATNQELSPVASPSPSSRQFLGIKSPTYPQAPGIPPTTPTQPNNDFQVQTSDSNDIYQSPSTPKPNFTPRLPVDPFAQQPSTPRPQFGIAKPPLQVRIGNLLEMGNTAPTMEYSNRKRD